MHQNVNRQEIMHYLYFLLYSFLYFLCFCKKHNNQENSLTLRKIGFLILNKDYPEIFFFLLSSLHIVESDNSYVFIVCLQKFVLGHYFQNKSKL
jgi:hypothetical protein